MINAEQYLPTRVAAAKAGIDALGAGAVLISKPENVTYLSGIRSSNCYLILTPEEGYILTDFRYIEVAENNRAGLTPVQLEQGKSVFDVVGSMNIPVLAVEEEAITYGFFKELGSKHQGQICSASHLVEDLRIVKDEYEKECLRKAEEIGDLAFTHICGILKEGMTEKEIALELEFFMRKSGAEGLSFETIAVSGVRSSMPHGEPSDKRIEPGDFLTMDYGCKYRGYCSDMTRTVAIGKVSEEMKQVYDIVRRAQQTALEAVSPGKKASDIDRTARDIIKYEGYGKHFGHGTGHGVGLEIHEAPTANPTGNTVLKPGMAVTVEPGIYLPGKFGVRIEDLALVTETGYEVLSHSEKDLIII